jgi:hypothetical protein
MVWIVYNKQLLTKDEYRVSYHQECLFIILGQNLLSTNNKGMYDS